MGILAIASHFEKVVTYRPITNVADVAEVAGKMRLTEGLAEYLDPCDCEHYSSAGRSWSLRDGIELEHSPWSSAVS